MSNPANSASLVLAIGALWMACAREADEIPGCHKDGDCATGTACVVGTCIPTLGGMKQIWAVEILPKSESAFAPTEDRTVAFSADPVTLQADNKKMVEGDITGVDAELLPTTTLRVLLSIPSSIGRSDRQFESQASRSFDDRARLHFSVAIPESAVGGPATVRFVPVSPSDKVLPVWTTALATLGPTIIVSVPQSNEVYLVEGVLQNALGDAAEVGFGARAMLGDRLVSNVDRTDDQGRFKLRIPKDPANAVDLESVTVELAPVDATTIRPRIVSKLTAAKLNLGILHLPALPRVQAFDVPVAAMGSGKKVPGVALRFYAALPGAIGGDGSLTGEFQTDKDGIAHASLFPGNTGETRDYAVAVIPPPNSEYAARCFPSYAVAASPVGQTRVGASIELGPKLELAGVISDATTARPGVILTAVRQDSTYSQECAADVTSPLATVTSGADGSYRLLLDPGSYRISYEPPIGSSSALFDEVLSVVRGGRRNVSLPAGVLADGFVNADDGTGVIGCEVRVFGAASGGQAPILRAHTRSDVDGRFRIVLPAKP